MEPEVLGEPGSLERGRPFDVQPAKAGVRDLLYLRLGALSRWRDDRAAPKPRPPRAPVDHYDDLEAEEIVTMLASLERHDLEALRDYEGGHASRDGVLSAIDSVLARRPAASRG